MELFKVAMGVPKLENQSGWRNLAFPVVHIVLNTIGQCNSSVAPRSSSLLLYADVETLKIQSSALNVDLSVTSSLQLLRVKQCNIAMYRAILGIVC
jgi:hypothetical protein